MVDLSAECQSEELKAISVFSPSVADREFALKRILSSESDDSISHKNLENSLSYGCVILDYVLMRPQNKSIKIETE